MSEKSSTFVAGMKKWLLIFTSLCLALAGAQATAPKGVFSVSATKTIEFATENVHRAETYDLFQFSEIASLEHDDWQVLTRAEWTYLLVNRDPYKNAFGTVDGKCGFIILPDHFVLPDGLSFTGNIFDYDANSYTSAQWTEMEDAGAVFLTCEGYGWMDGSTPVWVRTPPIEDGSYWTASTDDAPDGYAYRLLFQESTGHNKITGLKTNYYSVRLAREVVALDEQDELTALENKLGNTHLTDKDFALVYRTLGKDGTFYTLCLPFDVPDVEDSPLAGAEIFEFAGGTVSGSTGNEELNLNLVPLAGSRLTQGVPYILRWENTGQRMTFLRFDNVENWDGDSNTATDPGNETVRFHGVYPKAHIPGYSSGEEAHYNFFLGADNTLYWPDDATYGSNAKMKGFRAYFYITSGGGPASPVRRGMPAVWRIREQVGTATGTDNVQNNNEHNTKLFRDGQIILKLDGKTYTIGGQLL